MHIVKQQWIYILLCLRVFRLYHTRNLGHYVPLLLATAVGWYVSLTGGRPLASNQSIFVSLVKLDLLNTIVVFMWGPLKTKPMC